MGCNDWSDMCCFIAVLRSLLGAIRLTVLRVFVCGVEYFDVLD